jgi:hypothetical protein
MAADGLKATQPTPEPSTGLVCAGRPGTLQRRPTADLDIGAYQGLNCQKISGGGGVDICLFIVIVITHRRFSIINNGGGVG